jgi:hypothetical protein
MAHQFNQLERQAEAQRALLASEVDDIRVRFAETADDLRERLSPDRIVRRTIGKWRSLIEQGARDNPIQAAGVLALLAYPLWRVARALPLPMVIAGAGVFLAGKARFSTTRANELLAETRSRAHDAASRLAETAEQVRNGAVSDLQQVRARATVGASNASDMIQDAARSAAFDIAEHLGHAADSASAVFSNAVEALTPSDTTIQATKDGAQAAADAAKDVASRAVHSGAAYSRSAVNAVAQNPLLIGGVGLAAGGLFAALLPRTRADSQMLGGLARTLQKSAKPALKRSHQAVTKSAGDLYDRAAAEAEAHGLTVNAMQDAASDINERLGNVAAAAKRAINRRVDHARESNHD